MIASASPKIAPRNVNHSVAFAPAIRTSAWSATTPNWKTYFIGKGGRRWSRRPTGSEGWKRNELHAGVFLVDFTERAVTRAQPNPGVEEAQQLVIARLHGRRIERGRHC